MAKHPVIAGSKDIGSNFSSVIELPALLARRPLRKFVVIGGIARSGTTLVGQMLHEQPDVFCFEEFMMFKSRQHVASLDSLRIGAVSERNLWMDEAGRNWRGLSHAEDHQRLLYQLMALLAGGTSDAAMRHKHVQEIDIVACKTPSSEFTMLDLAVMLAPLPCVYVHCVREPWGLVKSAWEMPWVKDDDDSAFLRGMINHMADSLRAFRAIVAKGVPHIVVRAEDLWNVETSEATWRGVLNAVGSNGHAEASAPRQADHWPKDKRRKVDGLKESLRDWFLHEPEVEVWCREFGYR